jgi:hypothetical protein
MVQDVCVRHAAVVQAASHIRGVAAGAVNEHAPVAKAPVKLPAGAHAPPPDTLQQPSTTGAAMATLTMPQAAPTMYAPPGMQPQYLAGAGPFDASFPRQQPPSGVPVTTNMYPLLPPFGSAARGILQGQVMASPFPGALAAGHSVVAGQARSSMAPPMPTPFQSFPAQLPNASNPTGHMTATPRPYHQQPPTSQAVTPANQQSSASCAPTTVAKPGQTLVKPPPSGPEPQSSVLQVSIEPPEGYSLVDNLCGPGGSYLQHIESATSVTVQLRGKGVGGKHESDSPLSIWLFHPEPWKRSAAYDLAKSLIETVRNAAASFAAVKAVANAGDVAQEEAAVAGPGVRAKAESVAAGAEVSVARPIDQPLHVTDATCGGYGAGEEPNNGQLPTNHEHYGGYSSKQQQEQQQKQQVVADTGYTAYSTGGEQGSAQQASSQGQYGGYPPASGTPSGQTAVTTPAQAYPDRQALGYQGYAQAIPQHHSDRATAQQWQHQFPVPLQAHSAHGQLAQPYGQPGMPPTPQGHQPGVHHGMQPPRQQNWYQEPLRGSSGVGTAPGRQLDEHSGQWGPSYSRGTLGQQQGHSALCQEGAYVHTGMQSGTHTGMHTGVQQGPGGSYGPPARGSQLAQQNMPHNPVRSGAPHDTPQKNAMLRPTQQGPSSQPETKRKFREFKETVDKPPAKVGSLCSPHLCRLKTTASLLQARSVIGP